MNNVGITQIRPDLVYQSENLRKKTEPAISEVAESDTSGADTPEETEAGLQRLAQLIKFEKTKSKSRDRKKARGFEVYDSVKNFNEQPHSGQVLDLKT